MVLHSIKQGLFHSPSKEQKNIFMFCLFLLFSSSYSSLIGFDLGTETIKAAVIRSGRSIEIVLNEQSKRKTPGLVSLESASKITPETVKNVTRHIGISALPVLAKKRSSVIRAFPEIIGKESCDDLQALFDNRLYDFSMNKTLVNGVEPHLALAMLFEHIVHNAELQLQEGTIKDAVIAVPAFFSDAQRRKIAEAAKIAGLNLLEIIDEKHALAQVYAFEKTSFFTRESKNVAIVDIGHGKMSISAFKFSAKIVSSQGRSPRPVPKVEELDYVWDDTVGGIDFDVALAKHLSQKYNTPINQALLDDAQRLKHALTLGETANVSLDFLDHKLIFTREEFHSICEPIINKIVSVAQSLNRTFDTVEFVGGASRIPILIEKITSILGNQSRSLNGDEAIVSGAAYTAAMTSGAFKLKDITYDPSTIHTANLTYGGRELRLFSHGSSLSKLKTARLDAETNDNSNVLTLQYVSKIPVGCNKIIGQWEVLNKEPFPPISRLALSFGFNSKSLIILSKSQLYTKLENGEVKQSAIDVKRIYKPYKLSKEEKLKLKQLIALFSVNDQRLSKIQEAKNTYESLLFEIKESMSNDPIWIHVTSPTEKDSLNQVIKESIQWLDSHSSDEEFEDEIPIKEKTRLLEDSFKDVKYRVQEARTRENAVKELEHLLNDMQDAVLNRWPSKKMRVPKQQKKAILNHVKLTKEWLERKSEEQSELEPWDDPSLKTSEIELRIKKLGDAFKNLEEAVRSNTLKQKAHDNEDQFGADL